MGLETRSSWNKLIRESRSSESRKQHKVRSPVSGNIINVMCKVKEREEWGEENEYWS